MRVSVFHAAALVLTICTAGCMSSSGDRADGFIKPSVKSAFIALDGTKYAIFSARGSAVMLAPGIAVTNAHNENIVDADAILGKSAQYDLLFFRHEEGVPLTVGEPHEGEAVIAYGEGQDGELRVSNGVIRKLRAPVKPLCPVCTVQEAFTYESNAGPGFSGGPVLDAEDGRLIGITFGYLDDPDGTRLMYAYDMARVNAEFSSIQSHVATTQN